jgi:hypothetical protein
MYSLHAIYEESMLSMKNKRQKSTISKVWGTSPNHIEGVGARSATF